MDDLIYTPDRIKTEFEQLRKELAHLRQAFERTKTIQVDDELSAQIRLSLRRVIHQKVRLLDAQIEFLHTIYEGIKQESDHGQ